MPTLRSLGIERESIAALDVLEIVALIADRNGEVVYLSSAWERETGSVAADVLALGYASIVHPDDRDEVTAAWTAACAAGTICRTRHRLRHGNGSYRWTSTEAKPVRDASGSIRFWFGAVADIQDQRERELSLEATVAIAASAAREAREVADSLERILDASDDCIKVLDLDGRLVSISASGAKALTLLGLPSTVGTNWLSLWQGEYEVAAGDCIRRALADGCGRFTGMFMAGTRETWWDVTVTPVLDSDQRPERLLVVSRDITDELLAERAIGRSEERVRLLAAAHPGTTWTALPDGRVDTIGGSGTGRLPTEQLLGNRWLDIVHPEDRESTAALWSASVASGQPYDDQFRRRMADGSYRWVMSRALAQRNPDGTILGWIGVSLDIDDQRRALESHKQFALLAENSDDFIAIGDAGGQVSFVNAAGRKMLSIDFPHDARTTSFLEYFVPEDVPFVESDILPALERDGRWVGEFRLRDFASGAAIPIWYNVFALRDESGKRVGTATVSRDLRQRRRIDIGLRTLAETSAAMFESLDFERTLQNVAEAATRSFATYCVIDIFDDEKTLRLVATSHADPAFRDTLANMAQTRNMTASHPIIRAAYEGITTLIPAVGDDWVQATGMREGAKRWIDELMPGSIICVPLRSSTDGRAIGALSFGVDRRDQRGGFTEDDLRFAEEIALRAGIASDHARAYERERRIAVTLQAAALPQTLPTIPTLRLSADYRPGSTEATIGGDWYDAFTLKDGRVVLVIGDVLGHGLNAAVIMGSVRRAMRAAASLIPTPTAMLEVADRTLRDESRGVYATAIAGILDPVTRSFRFASAGHAGPTLRHADGRTEEFESLGIMLGLRAEIPNAMYDEVVIPVPPGSALVLFTDGLSEATRDCAEGQRRIRAAIQDEAMFADANPAHAIIDSVLRDRPATDDVAVLVVEVEPRPAAATR